MQKEIVLPPHLYDRIKASAGEHGGIGAGALFSDYPSGVTGVPLCAHGHAWGTCTRYATQLAEGAEVYEEPELAHYIGFRINDNAVQCDLTYKVRGRIPFDEWRYRLNVKRGKDEDFVTPAPSEQREAVTA